MTQQSLKWLQMAIAPSLHVIWRVDSIIRVHIIYTMLLTPNICSFVLTPLQHSRVLLSERVALLWLEVAQIAHSNIYHVYILYCLLSISNTKTSRSKNLTFGGLQYFESELIWFYLWKLEMLCL